MIGGCDVTDPASLGVIVTAVFLFAGSVIAALINGLSARRKATIAPYDALADRLASVEKQYDAQEAEISLLKRRVQELELREQAWQRGWDDLRKKWPWWRTQTDPPPYPTINVNQTFGE